ncbi:unnamed protein product, partial [Mesorhabditis belari]|uniref:Alpha-mannosidase n=1 Tax=Mesorhabditis belari TaxID=2138241 RepID=A0AAF3FUA6_9BILA
MRWSHPKNFFIITLLGIFVLVSFYLYGSLDSATTEQREDTVRHLMEVDRLKQKIGALQNQLHSNSDKMEKMRNELKQSEKQRKDLEIKNENDIFDARENADAALVNRLDQDLKGDDEKENKEVLDMPAGNKVAIVHQELSKATARKHQCSFMANYSNAKTNVQMLDMYSIMSFENVDGGVWKQGWQVTYKPESVKIEKKLEVILIPHSHCDPGWIMTFESYYTERTRNILNGMAKHLQMKPDMRFIYAEMSFFERWWAEQDEGTRERVRGYLKSGQFEIVTGGWVMSDEANAHFYSIITELIEGHEFIQNHIGTDYRPRTHWSIDPFGLSPSLPLLLSEANITNAALQRVHYSVKKRLAQEKQLEFMWRQLWGGSDSRHDIRSHVFPFYSYDVPHTCGPEPKICCQFDFKRLPGGGHSCDWGIPPQQITDANVEKRAFMIYDQYRKKSQLYKTNVLLVPLGDDFRYQDDFEWNHQHDNYKKLFEFMNQKTEWNVHARFGTLSDYFDALDETLKTESEKLPVLSGDFFTYADRDDHYWSGYFTSRPFHKQMDRVLQHYLRSAEILNSIARIQGKSTENIEMSKLVEARRALSLFQHHDGVTGTAKDAVMIDYAEKMLSALRRSEEISIASLSSLLDMKTVRMDFDEIRANQDSLPEMRTLEIGSSLILFNSLSHQRAEVSCIQISAINGRLKTIDGTMPEQQINPVINVVDGRIQVASNKFELCFWAEVGPLSTETYTLSVNNDQAMANIKGNSKPMGLDSSFTFTQTNEDFVLKNELISATFSGITGGLRDATLEGVKIDLNAHFVRYTARPKGRIKNGGGDDLSGAYLFLPDTDAKKMEITQPAYLLGQTLGNLFKRLLWRRGQRRLVFRIKSIYGEDRTILRWQCDLRLQFRVETISFTDLNNLQMIRRRRMLDKLPLQAHFYPMPGSAYIEDSNTRMTLIGAQALGVSSLKNGWLEVMLDRRLQQDDNRGLQQPLLDNRVTISNFRLLLEPIVAPTKDLESSPMGHLSSTAHHHSLKLHYPWIKVLTKDAPKSKVQGLSASFPCDHHLVTLRTMVGPTDYQNNLQVKARPEAALIVHRWVPECRVTKEIATGSCANTDKLDIQTLLGTGVKSIHSTSLTLLYQNSTPIITPIEVEPNRLVSSITSTTVSTSTAGLATSTSPPSLASLVFNVSTALVLMPYGFLYPIVILLTTRPYLDFTMKLLLGNFSIVSIQSLRTTEPSTQIVSTINFKSTTRRK